MASRRPRQRHSHRADLDRSIAPGLIPLFLCLVLCTPLARATSTNASTFIADSYWVDSGCPTTTPDLIHYYWVSSCATASCGAPGAFPYNSISTACTTSATPPVGEAYIVHLTTFLSGSCTNPTRVDMYQAGVCLQQDFFSFYTYTCADNVVTYSTYSGPGCTGTAGATTTFAAGVCGALNAYYYTCYDGSSTPSTVYAPGSTPATSPANENEPDGLVVAVLAAIGALVVCVALL